MIDETDVDAADDTLRFTLVLRAIPVELTNPKTGVVEKYTMRELDGTARDKYLNEIPARMTPNPDGKSDRMRDFTAFQSELLTKVLYDSEEALVPIAVLQTWPASVLEKLYDAAYKLSGLTKGAKEEAKNK